MVKYTAHNGTYIGSIPIKPNIIIIINNYSERGF